MDRITASISGAYWKQARGSITAFVSADHTFRPVHSWLATLHWLTDRLTAIAQPVYSLASSVLRDHPVCLFDKGHVSCVRDILQAARGTRRLWHRLGHLRGLPWFSLTSKNAAIRTFITCAISGYGSTARILPKSRPCPATIKAVRSPTLPRRLVRVPV